MEPVTGLLLVGGFISLCTFVGSSISHWVFDSSSETKALINTETEIKNDIHVMSYENKKSASIELILLIVIAIILSVFFVIMGCVFLQKCKQRGQSQNNRNANNNFELQDL